MLVPVTAVYAALLALMLLALKFRVIGARRRLKVDVLDGGERDVTRRMRVHGNFTEHVPIALILMAIVEINGAEAWNIHGLGIILVISRILHAHGLETIPGKSFGRAAGVLGTTAVIAAGALLALKQGFSTI
jgi:uncharacterized membrane protein YecN with MAPEG domain